MAETTPQRKDERKDWTLMFYMASDNPLVISIVSQLKALKAAGYHPNVNVIAQFDPYAEGTPTHVFDVNMIYKLKPGAVADIGFAGENPHVVRNLIEDKLWRHETDRSGKKLIRNVINEVMSAKKFANFANYDPPLAPELNGSGSRRSEPDPYTCLDTFLNFCCENYPAQHYMLFILGHGVVVGNDIFLYDMHAEKSSITLQEMGDALNAFKDKIEEHNGTLELVSFNSCSVSSLEVAYELKKTAKYMLASQGPTFVGSWPYREILMRIFKDLSVQDDNAKQQLLSDIFDACMHNSSDFLLAGYSYQVTLCDLAKIASVGDLIDPLSKALMDGLKTEPPKDPDALTDEEKEEIKAAGIVQDLIVYAHWKSQSFFQEMYTDLVDFCSCIIERIDNIPDLNPVLSARLKPISGACRDITKNLIKPAGKEGRWSEGRIVVAADFMGPAYQYSNGLSVYFPWTEPSEDSHILQQYRDYKFSEDLDHSWLDFLKVYFESTRRKSRKDEEKTPSRTTLSIEQQKLQDLNEDISSLVYRGEGPLGGYALNKTDPRDKTGNDCDCGSVKNYPRDTRSQKERRKQAQGLPVGQDGGRFGPVQVS